MKKRLITVLGLTCVAATCFGLAACTDKAPTTTYQKQGYNIRINYDANGGKYLNVENITLVDLYKPSDLDNGKLTLLEPTDASRPVVSGEKISLSRSNYFYCGWYQTRTERVDAQGNKLDAFGRELEEKQDDKGATYYVVKGTEEKSTIGYTYSNRWDFDQNQSLTVQANGNKVTSVTYPANWTGDFSNCLNEKNGTFELTLYAAWVPYLQFDYYYKEYATADATTPVSNEWVKGSKSTSFDLKTQQATQSEANRAYLPVWDEQGTGAMAYKYSNTYTFPSVADTTFDSAYLDANMTQKVTAVEGRAYIEHQGTLDLEHGIAVDPIQNVYVKVTSFEQFHITKASQLASNVKLDGVYTLMGDLDFTDSKVAKWPNAFATNTFQGQIIGNNHKIIKATATQTDTSLEFGGLFGQLGDKAIIKDVTFEDCIYDMAKGTIRTSQYIGLFAGMVDGSATVQNVKLSGQLRIGSINASTTAYTVNLIANGTNAGVTNNGISVVVYSTTTKTGGYQHKVNYQGVAVSAQGDITLAFCKGLGEVFPESEYVVYPQN